MATAEEIESIILNGWNCYKQKVVNGLLRPKNEKMMQLQLALIYQTMAPIFIYSETESISILLEVAVTIRANDFKSIDIVVSHTQQQASTRYPIELKCFRLMTRAGKGRRSAQNLGMYDYWEDIESIENYVNLDGYSTGFQFTLTDDPYYVETEHKGSQVATFSTYRNRDNIQGDLQHSIANRKGEIHLNGTYNMYGWERIGDFNFISQRITTSQNFRNSF